MLLGVETAQNLYEALRPKPFPDAAAECREELEEDRRKHAAQTETLERQLDITTKSGCEAGFSAKDFRWEALSARYKTLALDVAQLAAKHEVTIPDLVLPENLGGAKAFSSKVTKALGHIQTKASTQPRLASERVNLGRFETLVGRWTDTIKERDDALSATVGAEKEHGKTEDVATRRRELNRSLNRAREDLKGLNELYRILAGAHSYISEHSVKSCPVCKRPTDASELSRALERRLRELKSQDIAAKEKEIKTSEGQLKEVEAAESLLVRLRSRVDSCQKEVDKLIPQVRTALSAESLAEPRVHQRLTAAIAKSTAECTRLEHEMDSLLDQIEALNSQLSALNTGILPVLEKRLNWKPTKKRQRKRLRST